MTDRGNMDWPLEAAYVGIGSTHPEALAHWLGDVVGLMPGEPPRGAHSAWRVDGKAHRLWVEAAARDDALALGFEATSAARYSATLTRLERAGAALEPMTAETCALRRVRSGVAVTPPWGVRVEVVQGLADAATPYASAAHPRGFMTAGNGFGHVVLMAADAEEYAASCQFATEALGLSLSDWLRLPRPEGDMHASFFHCNPRHHSVAIVHVPGARHERRLNHVNFEVASVGDVGRVYERFLNAKATLSNTIGQHANDGMVSFYAVSPGGWRIEIGAAGRTIGADWSDVREYDRISDWGHQPPAALAAMLAAK